MDVVQIIILALFVEAVWETLKMCWQEGKLSWDRLGCLAIAIFMCIICKANVFCVVGLDVGSAVVGYVCTGILASRGSNFLHDLLERVRGYYPEFVDEYEDEEK